MYQDTAPVQADLSFNRCSAPHLPGAAHLNRAVPKHLHGEFLLLILQLQATGLHGQTSKALAATITELQEDGCTARIVPYLHSQDALARPLVAYMLQAINGRAGEDNVDVGQHEQNKQGLGGRGITAVSN